MGKQARGAEDVLAYWHAVEMFDPRDIPRLAETTGRKPGERCVEQIRFAGTESAPPLPWEPGHPRYGEPPATGRFGSEWRHFVYGGLFNYRPVRDEFAKVLGYEPGPDYGGTQRDSESAMFAFAVDQRGCLVDGASAFSSCMWAVGCLHRPGPGEPGWLEGFAKATRECERTLTGKLASRPAQEEKPEQKRGKESPDENVPDQDVPDQDTPPRETSGETERAAGDGESRRGVRAEDVFEFSMAMAKELSVPEGIADHGAIRIVSTPVFRRKDGRLADPEPVFLSSLIVPDLQRVQEAASDGFGAALASYLGEPRDPRERVDLAADRAALLDGVRPSAFPLARWPADTASALTTSQQFAVNTIMAELGGKRGHGLFAVNGPPGTGKTTLLRDLIATIVASRAEALAGLKEPGDAFTKAGSVWQPKRELTGFEIVVASSNNAAVENVTTELPTLNAIGDEWHGLANYLGEQAVAYLGPDAWGTIAVPLGKSENRLRFRDRLWFADGGLYQFLRARARERNGILGAGAQDEAWNAAVKAYKKARREASRLATIYRKQGSPGRWAELSQEEQELAAPWSDEEWTRARTRVFLTALGLHAAFVAGAADQLLHNMEHLLAVLSRSPDAKKGAELESLWQTLFLLVPVISTTFASCGRMFGAMGRESLGWLLIDEAGQALPQAAVGALWRSRRAVVVGDPMQLRPISQVPEEVQERLRGMFGPAGGAGVDAGWQPSAVSAQALADRRNKWGAEIRGPGGEVWVGAPLRVHRRCQEPMFGISNVISYGGLMVYGTQEQPLPGGGYPEYPRSSWVDVTGQPVGKWVPAQGEALIAVLRRLRDRGGVGLNRVYVLSPFREVVFRCRPLVRQQLIGDGVPENAARDFTQNRIGTVHTTQGKEADVVILVLGGDPSPRKRARDWAADPPNLLNVAVSRARRRLFVIGDRADWSAAPNFSVLAERLPRIRWTG